MALDSTALTNVLLGCLTIIGLAVLLLMYQGRQKK